MSMQAHSERVIDHDSLQSMATLLPAPVVMRKRHLSESNVLWCKTKRPRRLNYEKCYFCRRDKKSCERQGQWPQTKCLRCIDKEFDCSESTCRKAGKALGSVNEQPGDSKSTLPSQGKDKWLDDIQQLQNQGYWLQHQLRVQADAIYITNQHFKGPRVDAYSNFQILVETTQRQTIAQIHAVSRALKTQGSLTKRLLYTQILGSLLQDGLASSNIKSIEANDFVTIREQINEMRELGCIGLAAGIQETLLVNLVRSFPTSTELQEEVDELVAINQEFSSKFSPPTGLSDTFICPRPVALLLRPHILGNHRAVNALVKRGHQSSKEVDALGRTALHVALDHNPPQQPGWDGTRPLEKRKTRVHTGEYEVVCLLLEWEVSVTCNDNFGRTALHIACSKIVDFEIVKLLLEQDGLDIDAKDVRNRTPYWWAVSTGQAEVAELLLATGKVDINSVDNWLNRTPMAIAAQAGNEQLVKLSLEYPGARPNLRNIYGITPLLLAVSHRHTEVTKLLLQHGDVNDSLNVGKGQNLLSWAAYEKNTEMMELLVQPENIDVNVRLNNGHTPLSWASRQGNKGLVRSLLERGDADVDARDAFGLTAHDWAKRERHPAVTGIFREHKPFPF